MLTEQIELFGCFLVFKFFVAVLIQMDPPRGLCYYHAHGAFEGEVAKSKKLCVTLVYVKCGKIV